MASRRSRLKAVTNLPVRRKPATQRSAEDSKVQSDEVVESTLTADEREEDKGGNLEYPNHAATDETPAGVSVSDTLDSSVSSTSNTDSIPDISITAKTVANVLNHTENLSVKLNLSKDVSGPVQFGRRIKPSVNFAVLKERPKALEREKLILNGNESVGKENHFSLSAPDNFNHFENVNTSTKITETLNKAYTVENKLEQENKNVHKNEIENEIIENFNKKNQNTFKSQYLEEGLHKEDADLLQSNVESSSSSNQSMSSNVLLSNSNEIEENNSFKQTSEFLITSNNNVSDPYFKSSHNNIQLQFSSVYGKKNSFLTKPKKVKYIDFSKKVADAKKEFQKKYEKLIPDRGDLKMIDLIFYNPIGNPMESKCKNVKSTLNLNNQELICEDNVDDPDPIDKQADENVDSDIAGEEMSKMPVPQVKIGPNGEIILDEKSLVIETTEVKKGREDLKNSVPIYEDKISKCYYHRKTQKSRDWTDCETKRFYKALNTIGTDFSLMLEYFPYRTRLELKNKFKREEKLNRKLVDKALKNPSEFDIHEFEKYLALEKKEEERKEFETMLLRRKFKCKKQVMKTNRKSSLFAKELLLNDSSADNSLISSNLNHSKLSLQENKAKKSNEIDLLCGKYFSLEGENIQEEFIKLITSGNKNSSSESCIRVGTTQSDCVKVNKIRDALVKIKSFNLAEETNCENLITHDQMKNESKNNNSNNNNSSSSSSSSSSSNNNNNNNNLNETDVVDKFYDAVVSLSESLKSNDGNNLKSRRIRKILSKSRQGKVCVSKSGKRKLGRKNKYKEANYPFVNTLDVETYDSKYDSNSSSSESNDNSIVSIKTISDEEFVKLLAANVNNMKESKIKFQITESCSLEKNVEIILDNVPSNALSEIQNESERNDIECNRRIVEDEHDAEESGEERSIVVPSETYSPQRQETSVIVRNPHAIIRLGKEEEMEAPTEHESVKKLFGVIKKGNILKNIVNEEEFVENENVILLLGQNEGGVTKNSQYMMLEGQDVEVSLEIPYPEQNKSEQIKFLNETEVSNQSGTVDNIMPIENGKKVNVENLAAGSFVIMSTESEEPVNKRKFNVFMISEKSKSDGTSFLSSVPVLLPPEFMSALAKEL